MSHWKKIKQKTKNSPLGVFDKENRASEELSKQRMDMCLSCEHLIKVTSQCKKCGCFMKLKTTLKHVQCPIGKW
jgi:hypothetical protein